MKILYSLPHPADRLDTQRAGHLIRATAVLDALTRLGHEVVRVEAASDSRSAISVGIYRKLVRRLLPQYFALRLRDRARIQYSKAYAHRLIQIALEHKPDVILETHIALSLAGKMASERLGIPLVLDDCSPAWEEEKMYGVGLKEQAVRIHAEVTSHARLVVAVNETMRSQLLQDGLKPQTVITVPNGFDDSIFYPDIDGSQFRHKYQIPNDAIVIVFVGSFQPYHRVDLLLKAFQILNDKSRVYLLLVGDGGALPENKSLAAQLDLMDRVRFTGRVAYPDVPYHIAAGDIAVMPATNDYGNPMKIYEYMAIGKAVVAPSQPTIAEIATHGEDSFLFEPENVMALSKALDSLIGDNRLRSELGKNGSRRAMENSWIKRATILQNAIYSILSPDKKPTE